MPTLDRIEKNYFGVTLYVTTRTGREYACRADNWRPTTGGGLDVDIRTWPGYGHYRGIVHLTRAQHETFRKAQALEV